MKQKIWEDKNTISIRGRVTAGKRVVFKDAAPRLAKMEIWLDGQAVLTLDEARELGRWLIAQAGESKEESRV